MSVSAIGGMSPQVTLQAANTTVRPQAAEVKGQPDHDGDRDDRAGGSSVNVLA